MHEHVAVVGAGTMGAGIARVAAAAGHPVLLFDACEGAAARAIEGIGADLERRIERGKLARDEARALIGRLHAASALDALASAQVVVEAIVEDRDAKIGLFRDLERIVASDAILATNTSSISVTAIAGALAHPARCVGMHFFNPAHVMELVEIVAPLTASEDAVARATALAERWGKRPIRVRSTPGFVVNRVARPFYAEALRAHGEFGIAVADVDAALTESGGFRMGPFRLMDLIGNDVNFAVTGSVFEAFAYDRRFAPSLVQQELVDAGRLGRKSGRGFYDYAPGAKELDPSDAPSGVAPRSVVAYGDLGVAAALVALARERGIAVEERAGTDARIEVDGVALRLTDGAQAAEHARHAPSVLYDLALDYASCARIVVAAPDADPSPLAAASGFFRALGKSVSAIPDVPGLLVMRTVAAIANEACTMLPEGIDDATIDLAMTLGVNYPLGPLGWAERIGWDRVLAVLEQCTRLLGPERYRPAFALRSRALRTAGAT
ncbi:3-hydroxyacyl-CoA dehydrogenase [Vulcanimicrobium alpinum]|uniref:3-hydroxyacyl-CoA dehydrogenase n=1 Tax=Vulcanimicrobium alpinum TaxID=3016050 RepID=A0AAN1XXY8_UNVUL|nr:3-hydroxyacyl-CoA dehydrogenase [Vulcanimicrobium alpinum]BDE07414.1 3-hydroxyacyl-CoA dehydrogenase [Vulcanimicrobium alpinum]